MFIHLGTIQEHMYVPESGTMWEQCLYVWKRCINVSLAHVAIPFLHRFHTCHIMCHFILHYL
jgi:hypothetical protein